MVAETKGYQDVAMQIYKVLCISRPVCLGVVTDYIDSMLRHPVTNVNDGCHYDHGASSFTFNLLSRLEILALLAWPVIPVLHNTRT